MKISLKAIIFATLAIVASSCNAPTERTEVIGIMPEAENGYSLGVSACYAATNNGCLLLAGGCNFPDTPAAEGGKKRYYKGIYLTTGNSTLQWKKVGELPEASAYGVSLQYGNNLIIAGGMNEKSPSQAVNMLSC
jgi:sialate O-acetylesterase